MSKMSSLRDRSVAGSHDNNVNNSKHGRSQQLWVCDSKMAPKRKITLQQLDILLDFVEQNLDITTGRHPPAPGYLGVERTRKLWDTVATTLNSVADGTTKSGEQWKRYWIELKARVKAKAADSRRSNQFGVEPLLTPLEPIEERLLALVSTVAAEGMSTVRITYDGGCESKPKKLCQDNFTIVKKCCVNLVKKHGRSVTLFDDLAFRELIDLIPMTQSEKQTLTSQYIQTLLDDDQLDDQTDTETTMDKTTDDIAADDEDDTPLLLRTIKKEVEVIPCTCGKNTDESMSRHTGECPASSQQTCWNFFEVSQNSATCQICYKTLTWTDIATLKEHLQNNHPTIEFVNDGNELHKEGSEDGSTNDFGMEEVYLDETVSESEQTASAAKRRRKRARAALNITGPITRENIALSLQRFKSLDSFGQYVASLMKLIPKDKCIKLQIEMVERLLHEQAAAG